VHKLFPPTRNQSGFNEVSSIASAAPFQILWYNPELSSCGPPILQLNNFTFVSLSREPPSDGACIWLVITFSYEYMLHSSLIGTQPQPIPVERPCKPHNPNHRLRSLRSCPNATTVLCYVLLVEHLHLPAEQSPQFRTDDFLLLGLTFICTTARPLTRIGTSGCTRAGWSCRRFAIVGWLSLAH